MPVTFSAYVSVFNDWEILPDALAAIAPFVDEIVLVDGGYAWMVPYFASIGIDPERSDPRVRTAAEACGVRLRILSGIWASEIDKRMAGFAACTGRYIFRLDADEILVLDPALLARFVASGDAVATMEKPICVAPGLVRVFGADASIEQEGLLFDGNQVSAGDHLYHLWLELGPDTRPARSKAAHAVFPEPIAFNLHLTGWRTPETAIFRAAFYMLNYVKTQGVPWNWVPPGVSRDIAMLLRDYLPAALYRDRLLTSASVVGSAKPGGTQLRRTRHGANCPRLVGLRHRHLAALASLNAETAACGRAFINGDLIHLDLSTLEAVAHLGTNVGKETELSFDIGPKPARITASIYRQLVEPPWEEVFALEPTSKANGFGLRLPADFPEDTAIRRILCLRIQCDTESPFHRLTIRKSSLLHED
jgi:hypothetical protein